MEERLSTGNPQTSDILRAAPPDKPSPPVSRFFQNGMFVDGRNLIQFLKQSRLFQNLDDDALQDILSKARLRQYFANEIIVWEGKASDSLHFILNGIVAVKRVVSQERQHVFAFLMPGNTFGEVGILENRPRNATVAALNNVDVLVIQRDDFLDIMRKYPEVSIALCQQIARYLTDTNRRLTRGNRKTRLVLLVDLYGMPGMTSLAMMLAQRTREATNRSVVYTEFPEPYALIAQLQAKEFDQTIEHPGGFDVIVSHEDPDVPSNARTVLMVDHMLVNYDYIIATVKESFGGETKKISESLAVLLESTTITTIIAPPTDAAWKEADAVRRVIKDFLARPASSVLTLLNQHDENMAVNEELFNSADFALRHFDDFPTVSALMEPAQEIPEPLQGVLDGILDRLERRHQVAIYIPTTVDVDTDIDTSEHADRSLRFLAERFGGATVREGEGVWNSEEVGLVAEEVHIVVAHVTQADLNQNMDDIVNYMRQLKRELKQEAMALEIDEHLILI